MSSSSEKDIVREMKDRLMILSSVTRATRSCRKTCAMFVAETGKPRCKVLRSINGQGGELNVCSTHIGCWVVLLSEGHVGPTWGILQCYPSKLMWPFVVALVLAALLGK